MLRCNVCSSLIYIYVLNCIDLVYDLSVFSHPTKMKLLLLGVFGLLSVLLRVSAHPYQQYMYQPMYGGGYGYGGFGGGGRVGGYGGGGGGGGFGGIFSILIFRKFACIY